MRSEAEIRAEYEKLKKGEEWRNEHYWAVDMGAVIDGKFIPPKLMAEDFTRAEERMRTIEWILGLRDD